MPSTLERLTSGQGLTHLGRMAAALQPAYQREETYKTIESIDKETRIQNMTDFITEILPFAEKGQQADMQLIMRAAKKHNIGGEQLMVILALLQKTENERQVRAEAVAKGKREEEEHLMKKQAHVVDIPTKWQTLEQKEQETLLKGQEDIRKQAKTIFDELETGETLTSEQLEIINKVPEYRAQLRQSVTGKAAPEDVEYSFKKKPETIAGAEWVIDKRTGQKKMVPKTEIIKNPDLYEHIETAEEKTENERAYRKYLNIAEAKGLPPDKVASFGQFKTKFAMSEKMIDDYGNPAQRLTALGARPMPRVQFEAITNWLRDRQRREKGVYLFTKEDFDDMQSRIFAQWGVADNLRKTIEDGLNDPRINYDALIKWLAKELLGGGTAPVIR